jgi:O-antigen/teichoic acid export membrane protein
MLGRLKKTLKHTVIYSMGNVAVKLVGVVLLPLYTKHITVSDYGVLGILEVTIMILTETLILGQPNAYLRFYDSHEFASKRKSTLFTIFSFVFISVLLFCIIGYLFVPDIASYFSNPESFKIYFRLSLLIILLRVINNLSLTVLRAKEQSFIYAMANVLKIIVILGLNIYFIVSLKLGVQGILYAYIAGEIIMLILLFPLILREIEFSFDTLILKAALIFGLPLIFNSLAGMILNMGDRYILKLLSNYREVGLYSLGYKIAGLINIFLVKSFSLGFIPLAFKMHGQEGDKRYYSKMMTYLVFTLVWAGIALSVFAKDIVQTFALDPSYWSAYKIIPVIVLSYIILGAKTIAGLGMLLEKKTHYLATTTFIAMILNIVANFLLIPKLGMMGAAFATLISFTALYLLSLYYSNRFYPIPFENWKLIKLLLLSMALYGLAESVSPLPLVWQYITKIILILIFPILLYPLNFYEPIEIIRIKDFAHKIIRKK